MIYPSIDELMTKVDDKYLWLLLVKRARMLNEEHPHS